VTDATGSIDILRDIDFSVPAQQSLAIVGASGSGKSTLLSIMAGLDTPSQGTVALAGQDMFALDEDDRAALRAKQIGFVFQNFQLLGNMTALENVMLPLELAGMDHARQAAKEMLARVLLADEPTGSLDHASGERIMDLMFELNQELGTTLVLVTHDPKLAARCDLYMTIEAGQRA
jgi:putative ABC transport system ATP-binding protein